MVEFIPHYLMCLFRFAIHNFSYPYYFSSLVEILFNVPSALLFFWICAFQKFSFRFSYLNDSLWLPIFQLLPSHGYFSFFSHRFFICLFSSKTPRHTKTKWLLQACLHLLELQLGKLFLILKMPKHGMLKERMLYWYFSLPRDWYSNLQLLSL